ncbi:hypothetical protein B0H34DRAFT_796105 [Crassisporium funariophilum]|nr:hypothetical protein B0H34DRAFT_796105 [Crassisporium funariophilum]
MGGCWQWIGHLEKTFCSPTSFGACGSRYAETASTAAESENGVSDTEAAAELTEVEATKKIAEDSKEFFDVGNLDEAEVYFGNLPAQYHYKLVLKLVFKAIASKESNAKLVAVFFARAVEKRLSSPTSFEAGFSPIAEIIDDIAIDAPKAFQLFAVMIKGSNLDEERRSKLALKSMDSDKLLALFK